MAKIRYGKLGIWLPPFCVLLSLLTVIGAQPGFLSISCGGKMNHTAENNITWVSDAEYINVGQTADIGDASADGSYFHSLRFFPMPLIKSCYKLPVTPDVPYVLRLSFVIGDYNGFQNRSSFQFSIETLGMLHVRSVTITHRVPSYRQRILVSSGMELYICLIRTSVSDDPFISTIELRRLQHGMYAEVNAGTMLLPAFFNVGGNSMVRYPQDQFDRHWILRDTILNNDRSDAVRPVSSDDAISTRNTKNLPPTAVMQTAWVGNSSDIISIKLESTPEGIKSVLQLYFAEIETLNMSESRSFYVEITGPEQYQATSLLRSKTITLVPNHSAIDETFLPDQIRYNFNVTKDANSNRPPILNAFEYHWVFYTDRATNSQDIHALDALKRNFDIKNWISDPCYLVQWEGIGCDNSFSDIRISNL